MKLLYYGALTIASLGTLTLAASILGWSLHLKNKQDIDY